MAKRQRLPGHRNGTYLGSQKAPAPVYHGSASPVIKPPQSIVLPLPPTTEQIRQMAYQRAYNEHDRVMGMAGTPEAKLELSLKIMDSNRVDPDSLDPFHIAQAFFFDLAAETAIDSACVIWRREQMLPYTVPFFEIARDLMFLVRFPRVAALIDKAPS